MGFLTNIFSKTKDVAVKDVVDSVGNAIDQIFTSKEEKARVMLDIEKEVNRHIEFFTQNAQKDLELELADRDRASKMQIEALHQDDKFSKRFLYYLASFMILATAGFGVALCFLEVPEANQHLVEMYSNFFFISNSASVLTLFFGVSKNSHSNIVPFNNQKK